MRTVVYIVACVVVLSVISCTSRNRNGEDVQILMRDSTVVTAPQRMQVSDTKTTITYRGKEYRSSVVRRPDESLPVVKNEQGERFVDNSITLRITCGGRQVVDKVFTNLLSADRPLRASQTDRFRRWQNLHGEGGVAGRCVRRRERLQLTVRPIPE